ncbi:hypothetical protein [Streptomyces niveus]|uniref:hypothetical protein n=1 Tax=Streptomyces niveus TaxID=193462 RepID=UPI0036BF01E2
MERDKVAMAGRGSTAITDRAVNRIAAQAVREALVQQLVLIFAIRPSSKVDR